MALLNLNVLFSTAQRPLEDFNVLGSLSAADRTSLLTTIALGFIVLAGYVAKLLHMAVIDIPVAFLDYKLSNDSGDRKNCKVSAFNSWFAVAAFAIVAVCIHSIHFAASGEGLYAIVLLAILVPGYLGLWTRCFIFF